MAARELLEIRRVKILGCGSAYIAGCAGAHLIEQLARIPAHAEPASEFRYRNPVDRAGHALHRREPVRRNLRHARRRPGSEAQRRTRARHRQRRRQHGRARVRPRNLSARRPGDRGRRDEDVHVHAGRVRVARDPSRSHSRSVDGARRAAAQSARSIAGAGRRASSRRRSTSRGSHASSRSTTTPISSAARRAFRSRWKAR